MFITASSGGLERACLGSSPPPGVCATRRQAPSCLMSVKVLVITIGICVVVLGLKMLSACCSTSIGCRLFPSTSEVKRLTGCVWFTIGTASVGICANLYDAGLCEELCRHQPPAYFCTCARRKYCGSSSVCTNTTHSAYDAPKPLNTMRLMRCIWTNF